MVHRAKKRILVEQILLTIAVQLLSALVLDSLTPALARTGMLVMAKHAQPSMHVCVAAASATKTQCAHQQDQVQGFANAMMGSVEMAKLANLSTLVKAQMVVVTPILPLVSKPVLEPVSVSASEAFLASWHPRKRQQQLLCIQFVRQACVQ
jgi:hypothetical protein